MPESPADASRSTAESTAANSSAANSPAAEFDAPRVMFVHAHPDDESLWTGGTASAVIADGGDAELVTCTWTAGTTRHIELVRAASELGLPREPVMLGYADSFVPDSAPGAAAFIMAPFDEQVAALTAQLRRFRPHIVVTYDAFGMYGHPDHMHANRLTCAAADAAAIEPYHRHLGSPWQVRSLYFITVPRATVSALRPHMSPETSFPSDGTAPEAIGLTLDLHSHLGNKVRAINAHATELARSATMKTFAALPAAAQRIFLGWESYQRRDLVPGGADLLPQYAAPAIR